MNYTETNLTSTAYQAVNRATKKNTLRVVLVWVQSISCPCVVYLPSLSQLGGSSLILASDCEKINIVAAIN